MTTPLKVSANIIAKIMILLSILFLFRGHNNPGGGFIGALLATAAIALYTLAYGLRSGAFTRYVPKLLSLGLICFLMSLIGSVLDQKPPLTGLWSKATVAGQSFKLGTPIVFDIGVYCTVLGALSWLIAELEEKVL